MIADPSDRDQVDDEDFPLGDGTTETEVVVVCPHCGETNELGLDPGGGPLQEYVEDCQVCCRPWRGTGRHAPPGSAQGFTEPPAGRNPLASRPGPPSRPPPSYPFPPSILHFTTFPPPRPETSR